MGNWPLASVKAATMPRENIARNIMIKNRKNAILRESVKNSDLRDMPQPSGPRHSFHGAFYGR
jgi:hypothetical protein